jgi:Thoeris protein ThsB, TIR-like domain
MAKVPVFINFDFDHDEDLKNLLVGQSRNADSPFEITDVSVKQVSPTWEADARRRIRRADQVPVICGHYTDTATGVNKEIRIAREESKPYFLLGGRASGTNKKPTAATDHG